MQELCGWDNLRALKNAASPGKALLKQAESSKITKVIF
jgi:hypothetical protein